MVYRNICEILSEHRILLNQLLSKNQALDTVMTIFPINSEDKLGELDSIIATQKDLYVRYLKSLIKGNISKNLNQIFGHEIVMAFNIDGTHGKKRLKDHKHLYQAIIDAIPDELPEEKFRAALHKEKNKYFKIASKNKLKNNQAPSFTEEGTNAAEIEKIIFG